jgi:hypothetical protein
MNMVKPVAPSAAAQLRGVPPIVAPKLAYITFHGKGIMVSAVTLMKNVQRSWLMFLGCYLFDQIQTLDQTTKIIKVTMASNHLKGLEQPISKLKGSLSQGFHFIHLRKLYGQPFSPSVSW